MAEAIVALVVQRLGNLLLEKITFLRHIREKLERLQKELVTFKVLLKTADSIHNQDERIPIWVADVRDIAYDVDDIIDAFLLKASKEGEDSDKKQKKIFTGQFSDIGKEIDNILEKLKALYESKERFGITGVVQKEGTISSSEMPLRQVYLHTEGKDDDTIGLEDQTNTMVEELKNVENRLCVVSIHGMGGLGKTTLAKKVYKHPDIKEHFDCYAWTSISQTMNTKAACKEILSTLTRKDVSEKSEKDLLKEIYEILLNTKHYLVVLDDIWRTEAWDALKPAFPNKKGSKVMFTTRNLDVAIHADPGSFCLEPRTLTVDEAWELLCRKAFPYVSDSRRSSSSDFEKCGKNMVKRCGGFPLQVIVLGGILASKGTLDEWETVSKQIGTHRSPSQGDKVFPILSLSYNELPFNLKPLFLYLGLFPEDFLIPVKKVRMWMAESLIRQENEGETIEEVGTRYLDELIHRSMVQIGETSLDGKKVKTCRLHDKMRELCITIGREENFLEEINGNGGSSSSSCLARTSNKIRRCAIYTEEPCEKDVFPKQLAQSLRAAFFIQRDLPFSIINFKDFKLLKVLDFEGSFSFGNELARLLGKLTNLRYLRVRTPGTLQKEEILFEYFKNLVYLQTLDLEDIQLDGKEIFNAMHQLRYLLGLRIKLSTINKTTNLQTLRRVCAGPWMTDLVELTNLEKLGIVKLDKKSLRLFTMAISGHGLEKLRSLYLEDEGFGFPLDLLEALSRKRHLKKLTLWGSISKLPSQFPSNLVKLFLGNTECSEDLMQNLEKLEHLLLLRLSINTYFGKQMVCSAKGFPKLKHLLFWSVGQWEEWTVEKGAMPCLTRCEIIDCTNLKMVPQGFKFLTMLQELVIDGLPKSFNERVKQGGEDWETVQHIPSITITPSLKDRMDEINQMRKDIKRRIGDEQEDLL